MKIIEGPRQSGKTYKAVQWLLEDIRRVILVGNRVMKTELLKHYPDVHPSQVMTYEDARMNQQRKKADVLIDNVEDFIRTYLSTDLELEGFTMSAEQRDWHNKTMKNNIDPDYLKTLQNLPKK